MGYWERLIDMYESWDYDSLVEEAYQLSCVIRDDIARRYDMRDPLNAAFMVAAYFIDADRFADGAEVSLIRDLWEGSPIERGGDFLLRAYRQYDWEPWVIDYLHSCRGETLEAALRFGMVICASDGFIRDEERYRILKWT